MPFAQRSAPFGRWILEFALILLSVYLAVYLEGVSQSRSEASAAREGLAQLLGELREDHADLVRIVGVQGELDGTYSDLDRWLRDPRSAPADSVGAALYQIAAENPTLFARRASWSTMIAAGQLAALDDPALVLRLGQLYETIYPRIDYNSSFYDQEVQEVLHTTMVVRWSDLETEPLVDDSLGVEQLRLALGRGHYVWNLWYRDLLLSYEDDLAEAIAAVERYLEVEGV